jgi:fibronectin-binding autotransporter adhesin
MRGTRVARLLAFGLAASFPSLVQASTWLTAGNGSWNAPANWDTTPNSVNAIADFSTVNISTDASVTLDGNFTVGTLRFGDAVQPAAAPSSNWILNPGSGGPLTLDVSTGTATIDVVNQSAFPIPLAGTSALPQKATINAVLAGNDGLTKIGFGNLVLTAANTYTGGTNVQNGALTLDFASTSTDILTNGSSLSLGGGVAIGSGGILNLIGGTGATSSQTFGATTLNFGPNAINVTQNNAIAVNLNLGTFTRTIGGALSLTLPTAGGISAANASIPNVNGILGAWATIGSGATATWAANDGTGKIVAYTGFTNVTGAPTIASGAANNVRWQTSSGNATLAAGTTDINTLLFTDGTARTLTIGAGNTLRVGATGGIFKSSTSNIALTIAGPGTLTAGGAPNTAGELNIIANCSAPDTNGIVINAPITNNGTGVVTLIKNGNGALQLGAANTYSGGTYINSARIRASVSGALGTGPVYVAPGAQAYIDTGSTFSNNFFISGKAHTEANAAGNFVGGALRLAVSGANVTGNVTLLGDSKITARGATTGATISGKITGNYNLELGNTVATAGMLIFSNTTNDWGGNTTLSGVGVLRLGNSEVIPNGAGRGNITMISDVSAQNTAGNATVIDLNAKTETINGLSTTGDASRVFITSSAGGQSTFLVGDNNATSTFGGVIGSSGTGAILTGGGSATAVINLTKIGSGTLTLTGANNYTGTTRVNAGTLTLSSATSNNIATSPSVIVASGATLNITGLGGGAGMTVGATQNLTNNGTVAGNVILGGGASISGQGTFANNVAFNTGGTERVTINGASSDFLHITGAADFTGGGGIQILLTGPATSPFYDILTYGTLPVMPTVTPNVGRTNFTIDTSPGVPANTIRIKTSGGPASIVWNNAGATAPADGLTWDIQNNRNWKNAGSPDLYYEFDNVTFDDNNSSHYSVTIPAAVNPGNITVNNSAGDYVFGTVGGPGSIGGLGTLTKGGTGTLTLNTPNSYSGGTVFNQGTLNINTSTAIGTGPIALNSGNIGNTSGVDVALSTNNVQTWASDINYPSPNSLNLGTGAITMNVSPTITVSNAAATLTFGGGIAAGTGTSITKMGAGTLALTGSNTNLTGGITVNEGTLRATGNNSSGSGLVSIAAGLTAIFGGTQSNSILAANNNTFGVGGSDYTMNPGGTMTVAGTVTMNTFDPLVPGTSRNFQVDGTLVGSGVTINIAQATGVTSPDGSNGLRLRGPASSFTGTINVPQTGKFEMRKTTADPGSPAGTAKIVLTAGVINADATFNGTYPEFNLRNNSNANTVFGNDVEIVGTGAVVFNAVTDTGGGGISATSNVTSMLGNLKIGDLQEVTVQKNTTTGPALTVGFSSVTLTGGKATFSPKKAGFGAANLDAGDFALGPISELTAGSGIIMNGLRTLSLNGNNSFTGGLAINSGTVRLGNAGALNSTVPQIVTFTGFDTVAPAILQVGGNNATAGGVSATTPGASVIENASATPGALTIKNAGTNTFAGVVRDGTGGGALSLTSDGGTLYLSANNTYTGATVLANNTTLRIGDGNTTGTLSGTSGVSGTGSLIFNRGDSSTVTLASPVSGAVSIQKEGSNTLVLSGANTTLSATIVNGGALVVTGSLPSTAAVMLNIGTLSGANDGINPATGKIGNVTAGPGSLLTAGSTALDNSIGTLTMASLNSDSPNYKFDITNTTVGDRIIVTGAATLTGSSSFSFNFTGLVGPGLYPLLTAGNLNVAGATLTAVGPSGNTRLNFGLLTTPGANGTIKLNVTGAAANLTWTGAQTSDWDLVNSINWKTTTNPNEKYFELDAVTFDDSAPLAKHTVNVTSAFTPSSLTFNNNTDYTLNNGSISPNGGLFKSGTGKAIVNSQVTGIANVQVDGGILAFTTDNNYTGTTTINANGTLQIGDLSVNSGQTGSIPDAPITNNGTLKFARGLDQTFTTLVSGTGQIMQSGTGTLTFNGTNNTLTGGATVNNGFLKIATNVGALGTGPITVATGGTFISAIAGLTNPINLAGGTLSSSGLGTGAGTVYTSGDVTVTADSTIWIYDPATPTTGSEVDFTGTLHGTKNINVLSQQLGADGGAGFRLRGTLPSDYSGVITIGQSVKGELQTAVAGPFSPAGTGTIRLTGGSVNAGSLNGTYSELNLRNNFTGNTTFGNNVEVVGNGFADINLIGNVAQGGAISAMGSLKIGDQQILGVNRNGVSATVPGIPLSASFTSVTLTGGNATFSPTTGLATAGWNQPTGMNLFLGPISETAASSITLDGNGILRLDGNNTYSGSTTIMRGTLQLGASNRIPDTSPIILNGGTLKTAGFSETAGIVTLGANATLDLGGGASTVHFAASNASAWSGLLTVQHWASGSDHLVFGNSLSALTSSQLAQVIFPTYSSPAIITATGEVMPGSLARTLVLGDFSMNGVLDATDLSEGLKALTNLAAFQADNGLDISQLALVADIDSSGSVNNRDIQPLLALLVSAGFGSVAAVPEPSTFVLLACGVAGVLACRRRRVAT